MPTWSESQKPSQRQEAPPPRTGLPHPAFHHDPQTLAKPARGIRRTDTRRRSDADRNDRQYAPLKTSGRPSGETEIGRPIQAHRRFRFLRKRAIQRRRMLPGNQALKKCVKPRRAENSDAGAVVRVVSVGEPMRIRSDVDVTNLHY